MRPECCARLHTASGVEYTPTDLSQRLDPKLMREASAVIHAAAETVGGWEEHERNSIWATENVLRTAAAAGVRQLLHVSSIAVLATQKGRSGISEEGAFEPNPRRCGPYVWGKLQSEKLARKLAAELDLKLRIVRPGAVVDYQRFDPPGRLGKRVGNMSGRQRRFPGRLGCRVHRYRITLRVAVTLYNSVATIIKEPQPE